jgi:hypothetical protein
MTTATSKRRRCCNWSNAAIMNNCKRRQNVLYVVMIITVRLLFTHYTASIANNVDAVLL